MSHSLLPRFEVALWSSVVVLRANGADLPGVPLAPDGLFALRLCSTFV